MQARLSHILIRALIAASLAGGAVMAFSAAAQAYDAWPCLGPHFNRLAGRDVQVCPDWSPNNRIPVHAGTSPRSRVVGEIYAPGDDWYVCQARGDAYGIVTGGGAFHNIWYAFTYADNLQSGWVSEVYFRGGDNNEEDRKLQFC